MSGPTTRVLAALELLQNHNRIGGGELAERLQVDRRTVRRYITILEELGVPVTTEQGRHGGYMLVPGYKLPPMMFTDEEALAVSIGIMAARELGMAQATPAIDSLEAKLERVLPGKLKQQVQSLRRTTRLMLPQPDVLPDDRALITLTRAIQGEQRVDISYQPPGMEITVRQVDPYGLTFWNSHWYLSGFCHLRQALRSFRLDRVRKVTPLPAQFQRPANFNAADHLMQSLRAFPRNHAVSVVLHTDEETAGKFLECVPSVQSRFKQLPDGLLLNMHTDNIQWFAVWLARLPFPFSIQSPPALKQALRKHAEQLLAAAV